MTDAGKGHRYGRNGILAIRREFWEDAVNEEEDKDEAFIPTCPHCKAMMVEMVTMPVFITQTDIPPAYMICCPSCKAVIHTITSDKKPYDGWLEEIEKNR